MEHVCLLDMQRRDGLVIIGSIKFILLQELNLSIDHSQQILGMKIYTS